VASPGANWRAFLAERIIRVPRNLKGLLIALPQPARRHISALEYRWNEFESQAQFLLDLVLSFSNNESATTKKKLDRVLRTTVRRSERKPRKHNKNKFK